MFKILIDDLWPTLTQLAKKSKHKHVAVAYLGRGANRILPLGEGDSLVVDMSIDAVKSGQTDPNEIEKYFKKGVDLYTCSNLHAKTYVFDNTLIVGSANVSKHSKINLIEAGLLCKDADMRVQACGWIKSLQKEPITPAYIKQCKRIYKPPKMRYRAGKKKGVRIPEHSRLWVLSVIPTDYSKQENRLCRIKEREAKKKIKDARRFEVSPIRWDGTSRIAERIKESDLVAQIYSEGKKTQVYPPSRVVQITPYATFDKKKKPMLFIYIEEPKNPLLLSWSYFARKVANSGLRISRNSNREVRKSAVKHTILGMWSNSS